MTALLLDTNICSIALLGDIRIVKRLEEASNQTIAINATTIGELVHTAEQSRDRTNSLKTLTNFVVRFHPYSINEDTAEIYGQLKAAVFDATPPKTANSAVGQPSRTSASAITTSGSPPPPSSTASPS
jgi:tRNA(fMet)-specific endonuclease VapC